MYPSALQASANDFVDVAPGSLYPGMVMVLKLIDESQLNVNLNREQPSPKAAWCEIELPAPPKPPIKKAARTIKTRMAIAITIMISIGRDIPFRAIV